MTGNESLTWSSGTPELQQALPSSPPPQLSVNCIRRCRLRLITRAHARTLLSTAQLKCTRQCQLDIQAGAMPCWAARRCCVLLISHYNSSR